MIPLSPAPRYALPLMCVLVNASFALCPRPAARRVTATGPAPACPPLSLVARAAPRNTPRQAPPQAPCPHPRVGGSAQARITPVTPGSRARPRPALLARPRLNPSVRPRLAQLVHHHARLAAARPARLIRTRPARGGDSRFLPLFGATRSATRPTVWTSVDLTALAPSRQLPPPPRPIPAAQCPPCPTITRAQVSAHCASPARTRPHGHSLAHLCRSRRYTSSRSPVLVNTAFAFCPLLEARSVTATRPAPARPLLSLVARAAPHNTPRQPPPQAP